MTFGGATGQGGLIAAALNMCADRVKSMKSEWDVHLNTTFVKLFEEDILVRELLVVPTMSFIVSWVAESSCRICFRRTLKNRKCTKLRSRRMETSRLLTPI